jgi:hypothetical protein
LAIAIWTAGIYLLTFVISLVLFAAIVVFLPPRYFVQEGRSFWVKRQPLVRWLGIIGKNFLGLVIIAIGILLSLPGIPGQGLLTMLIGVMLLDIPGKRQLMRAVVRRPRMLQPLNRLRSWFGRPPLVVEEPRELPT